MILAKGSFKDHYCMDRTKTLYHFHKLSSRLTFNAFLKLLKFYFGPAQSSQDRINPAKTYVKTEFCNHFQTMLISLCMLAWP